MKSRRGHATSVGGLLSLCFYLLPAARLEAQGLIGAEILPAKPTTDNPVRLRIHGEFRDSCPRIISTKVEESRLTDRGVFTVTVNVRPSPLRVVCLDVITPFEVDVDLGYPIISLPYQVDILLVAEDGDKIPYDDMTRFRVDLGVEEGLVGARIMPERPSSDTPITLELHGLLIGCGGEAESMRADLDTARQRIQAILRVRESDVQCFVPEPFQFHGALQIGALPPGTYTVDGELVVNGDAGDTRRFPALGQFEVFPTAGDELFVRGDVNQDGEKNITDPIFILSTMFFPGPGAPLCMDAMDVDDSGVLDLTDPIYLLNHLFLGGPLPPPPGPDKPGVDLTGDPLGCPARF